MIMTTKPSRKILVTASLIWIAAALPLSAATLTVTNTNDSGPGSLRDALTQANSNAQADTINFEPAFFSTPRTITLTSGELQITRDDSTSTNLGRLLTVNGPGPNLLIISGNNASRVFDVTLYSNLVMSGMTVRDGNGVGRVINSEGPSGGGMLAQNSILALSDMIFRNNTVTDTGGGLHLSGGAQKYTLTNVIVTENRARTSGGLHDGGCAVKVLRNTTISNNFASSTNGGARFRPGMITMENCLVTGNTAIQSYGGLEFFQVNGTVTDTVISNNSAGYNEDGTRAGTSNLAGYGGLYAEFGTITFRRIAVTNNRATTTCSGIGFDPASAAVIDSLIAGNSGAAGLYAGNSNGEIHVVNTTIANNSNTLDNAGAGGGILNNTDDMFVINCTITGNHATDNGGGIRDNFGTTQVQNTIIANNTAPTGPDISGTSFISRGHNIIGNVSGGSGIPFFGVTGDQVNVNPLLDPSGLQNNGGSTLTIALQPNSPAINAGSNALAVSGIGGAPLAFDQRSEPFDRIVNTTVDIGAFEVQPPPNTQPGSNVTQMSASGDASVAFPAITRAGLTRFNVIDPASAGALPPGYILLSGAPAYNITSTAGFTPPLLVCFTLPANTTAAQFARARILHQENGVLVDRTILAPNSPAPDFAARRICARVDSLSPFVVALAPSQLQNISTRLRVESGDNVLIGGFIITGPVSKKVIVRAIGPSLPTAGNLADPTLELRDGTGALVASNDNWRTGGQEAEIVATTVPPANDLESALVATVAPGSYTVVMRGQGNTTGVGLVEIFDLESNTASRLANISTRGFVQTGDDVMIGGFILGPNVSGPIQVIARAIGPSLPTAGNLADPTLEIADQNGTILAANDNWRTGGQEAEIIATTVPPANDLESAIVITLGPAPHTVIVRGKNGGTGVGLVEAFALQ